MSDVRDPRVRELVHRIVAQAPEPAPFPIVAVATPRRHRGRMLAAVAVMTALAVLLAVVAAVDRPQRAGEPGHVSTASTTEPPRRPTGPIGARAVPSQGLLFVQRGRMTLLRDDGTRIATLPSTLTAGARVLNSTAGVELFASDDDVRPV